MCQASDAIATSLSAENFKLDCRYERKPPCSFKNIVDTQFVGAMGPPGGGRNPVSARVLRHFNILSFTELSDDSVGRIFTTILGAFLQRNFGADISELSDKVCNKGPATLSFSQ